MRIAAALALFASTLTAQALKIVPVGKLTCGVVRRSFDEVQPYCNLPGLPLATVANTLLKVHYSLIFDYPYCWDAVAPIPPAVCVGATDHITWGFILNGTTIDYTYAINGGAVKAGHLTSVYGQPQAKPVTVGTLRADGKCHAGPSGWHLEPPTNPIPDTIQKRGPGYSLVANEPIGNCRLTP